MFIQYIYIFSILLQKVFFLVLYTNITVGVVLGAFSLEVWINVFSFNGMFLCFYLLFIPVATLISVSKKTFFI